MSKGISKGASPLRWLAPALGMGLLALISYTQATGPRRPAPDALAANQPAAARDGQTLAAVSPDGRPRHLGTFAVHPSFPSVAPRWR